MSDDRDDARRLVLARRARFVAAALAGVGVACGKMSADPGPCLSVAYVPPDAEADAGTEADAAPEAAPDAPTDAATDAGTKMTKPRGDAAAPAPCLVPPLSTAKPRPCLSVVRPKDVKQ